MQTCKNVVNKLDSLNDAHNIQEKKYFFYLLNGSIMDLLIISSSFKKKRRGGGGGGGLGSLKNHYFLSILQQEMNIITF